MSGLQFSQLIYSFSRRKPLCPPFALHVVALRYIGRFLCTSDHSMYFNIIWIDNEFVEMNLNENEKKNSSHQYFS